VAYYGRGDKVVDHFAGFGMHCSPHYNPADFISTCVAVYTVNLRIEAPGFYQHKSDPRPVRGLASICGPASIRTCQLCAILFKNHQPVCTSTSILFIFSYDFPRSADAIFHRPLTAEMM